MIGNQAENTAPLSAKTYRRWLPRLSLRGLMVLVLVLGGTLGWITHRVRVKREAVEAARRSGGSASYDFEMEPQLLSQSRWRRWVQRNLGPELAGEVTRLRLGSARDPAAVDDALRQAGSLGTLRFLFVGSPACYAVNDQSLAHLAASNDLNAVIIGQSEIQGPGLKHLAGKRSLSNLSLASPYVDDSALAQLGDLPSLVDLSLRGRKITDASLPTIARWKTLQHIDLSETNIHGSRLDALQAISRVVSLHLNRTPIQTLSGLERFPLLYKLELRGSSVTDNALEPIAGMSSLQWLYLDETPITDAGMKIIATLPSLFHLSLKKTRITDAGLSHLKGHPTLQLIDLTDTRVSDKGTAHLEAIPTLKHVNLDGAQITDEGVIRLTRNRNLASISVCNTMATEVGVIQMRLERSSFRIQWAAPRAGVAASPDQP